MKHFDTYKELFLDISEKLYNKNMVSKGDIADFDSEIGYEMKKLFEMSQEELSKYSDIEDYLSYQFNDANLIFEYESEPFSFFTKEIWIYLSSYKKRNFIKNCK